MSLERKSMNRSENIEQDEIGTPIAREVSDLNLSGAVLEGVVVVEGCVGVSCASAEPDATNKMEFMERGNPAHVRYVLSCDQRAFYRKFPVKEKFYETKMLSKKGGASPEEIKVAKASREAQSLSYFNRVKVHLAMLARSGYKMKISYFDAKDNPFAKNTRKYSDGMSIQQMHKPLRNFLIDGIAVDLDIKCCHQACAFKLGEDAGIEMPETCKYLVDRDKLFKEFNFTKLDMQICMFKDNFTSGNEYLSNVHLEFAELKMHIKKTYKDEYAKYKSWYIKAKQGDNPLSSFLSLHCQRIEFQVLSEAIKIVGSEKVQLPMYDGCVIDIGSDVGFHKKWEEFQGANPWFGKFEFVKKEIENEIVMDDDFEDFEMPTSVWEDFELYAPIVKFTQQLACFDKIEEKLFYVYDAKKCLFNAVSMKSASLEIFDYLIEEVKKHENLVCEKDYAKTLKDIKENYSQIVSKVPELPINRTKYNKMRGVVPVLGNKLVSVNGELMDRVEEHRFTFEVPCDYSDSYDVDYARNYFNTLFCGDGETAQLLIDAIFSILNGYALRHFICMTGKGSNGKSMLIRLMQKMLGHQSHSVKKNIVIQRSENSKLNDEDAVFEMYRLGFVSECKEGDKFNEERIKAVSGGDTINIEEKNQTPRNIDPIMTLFMACNVVPSFKVDANDLSFSEHRLRVFEFNNTFEKSSAKETEIFDTKFNDIVNYVLHFGKIIDGVMGESEKMLAAKKVESDANDILGQFIESGVYERDETSEFKITDFKELFLYWGEKNECKNEVSALMKKVKAFASSMEQKGLVKVFLDNGNEKKAHGARLYKGLRLASSID